MPKNFVLESIRHHLLRSLERSCRDAAAPQRQAWERLTATFEVSPAGDRAVKAGWREPVPGELSVDRARFVLYQRGDAAGQEAGSDPFETNRAAADAVVAEIASKAGLVPAGESLDERLRREATFHDKWAQGTRPEDVLVRESFEARTAPEHRFILEILGDLRGKRVLDLGCGLGEAAAYFAGKGARVTACDLSEGMLEMAAQVAARHGAVISKHRSPAEKTGLPEGGFDVVYAGNVLHHVDIAATLDEIRRVLAPGGVFVTWDPLAHNPLINVYRKMASAVRTPDEHPLKMSELGLFEERFRDVQWKPFWFFTLAVFVRFYLWERVHPSKERYWKKILTDASRLTPFYDRLEACDRRVLKTFPWLGRYCWNIVVWGRK